ncbi:MAG TPA: DUF305 domain-containing protein, partial [Woeseiaceae bacterium]
MSYVRFGLMILTSTVVMFVLMYLNTYSWEHVYYSETRTYMAIMMGATMAVIMLAYMLGMYSNRMLNLAIFVGAAIVFALSLWLVRSQITVSGPSFMRAMIPHHSIAVMTSERAQIRDPRVRKLADEIMATQQQEIAEQRYLIEQISSGYFAESVYEDPPAEQGSVEDALSRVRISTLDLAPMPEAEADEVLAADQRCTFAWSSQSQPILWTARDGAEAVMKLNGVLISLPAAGELAAEEIAFAAPGTRVSVRSLGDEADWRENAQLVFELDA